MSHPRPATVGQLKETGYQPRSVKDELRRNVIRKLKAGEELFPGIVGYRETVLPQIQNAGKMASGRHGNTRDVRGTGAHSSTVVAR